MRQIFIVSGKETNLSSIITTLLHEDISFSLLLGVYYLSQFSFMPLLGLYNIMNISI